MHRYPWQLIFLKSNLHKKKTSFLSFLSNRRQERPLSACGTYQLRQIQIKWTLLISKEEFASLWQQRTAEDNGEQRVKGDSKRYVKNKLNVVHQIEPFLQQRLKLNLQCDGHPRMEACSSRSYVSGDSVTYKCTYRSVISSRSVWRLHFLLYLHRKTQWMWVVEAALRGDDGS